MSEKQIKVKDLSKTEKVRVYAGIAALTGVAALVGAVGIGHAKEASPLDNTHSERVSVTFGDQANTEEDMAHYLQEHTGTPDSTQTIEDRLKDAGASKTHAHQQGEQVAIVIDDPK